MYVRKEGDDRLLDRAKVVHWDLLASDEHLTSGFSCADCVPQRVLGVYIFEPVRDHFDPGKCG